MKKTTCYCGGTLWLPAYVAGIHGCRDLDLAIKLIKAGLCPWKPIK